MSGRAFVPCAEVEVVEEADPEEVEEPEPESESEPRPGKSWRSSSCVVVGAVRAAVMRERRRRVYFILVVRYESTKEFEERMRPALLSKRINNRIPNEKKTSETASLYPRSQNRHPNVSTPHDLGSVVDLIQNTADIALLLEK